ncbi:hypothetical protein Tco_0326843 [Tanacetum coccineum]
MVISSPCLIDNKELTSPEQTAPVPIPKKTAWEQFSSNIATAVIYMQRNQLQQHTRSYPVPSLSMKVFNNMKRPTKAFSGQEVALFPTMLDVTEPSTSPSRVTSSLSHSPEHSPSHSPEHSPSPKHSPSPTHSPSPAPSPTPEHITASPTQPSPTQPSPGAEHHLPIPNESPIHAVHSHGSDEGRLKLNELTDLVTKLFDRIGVLEADLKITKQTYSSAFTKLILRVKKLEAQIKIGKARRRAKIVHSDDEDIADYSSKQGRILSDAEVQEKASNGRLKPVESRTVNSYRVIQDQESMKKEVLKLVHLEQNKGNYYKISDFKGMSYDEIRPIFEKVWDFNQNIEPIEHGPEKMKSPEKIKSPEKSPKKIEEEDVVTQEEMKEVVKEPGAKRKKYVPRKSTRKRQKMEEAAEKEELKGFLDIIPREEVPIEVESLSPKFPIMDWKTCVLIENFMYYQVFRGDGSSKNYKVLSEMLEDFDRQDVEEL